MVYTKITRKVHKLLKKKLYLPIRKRLYSLINREKVMWHTKLILKSKYSYFTLGNWTAYLLQLLMTFILTEFFDWWQMLSYATALLLGTVILFFYHERVTFRFRHPIFKERLTKMLTRFLIWAGLLMVLSWIVVYVLAEVLGLYYLLAIVLTGPLLSLFNYYVNKRWVFEGWKPKGPVKKNPWLEWYKQRFK